MEYFESATQPSNSSIQPIMNRNILEMPNEILHEIFKFISFEQISKMRIVCRRFNKICSDKLNNEFYSLRNYTQRLFHSVKSQMPRRESARRKHALAKEYDIIETLNMRLTLLEMTFSKHIKRRHCCFFPGEVIDEVHRILNYIKQTSVPNRAKVTDELFDLSTMAMEFFKENIEPNLPDVNYFILDYEPYLNLPSNSIMSLNGCLHENNNKPKVKSILDLSPSNNKSNKSTADDSSKVLKSNEEINDNKKEPVSIDSFIKSTTIRIKRLEKSNAKNDLILQAMKATIKAYKRKFTENQKQFHEQQTHLDELDSKNEAFNVRFNEIVDEMNQLKEELHSLKNRTKKEASTQTSQQESVSHLGLAYPNPLKRFKLSTNDN